MSDLVIYISWILDRMSHFLAQEPPITLAQIMQLFFHDRFCDAQGRAEIGYEMSACSAAR